MKIVYQKKFDYRKLPSQTPDPKLKDMNISKALHSDKDEEYIEKIKDKSRDGVLTPFSMVNYEYERNEKGYYWMGLFGYESNSDEKIKRLLDECYVDLLGYYHKRTSEINQSLIDFYMGKIALKDVDADMFVGKTGDKLIEFVEKLGTEAVIEAAKAKGYNDEKTAKVLKKHIEKMSQFLSKLREKKLNDLKEKENLTL